MSETPPNPEKEKIGCLIDAFAGLVVWVPGLILFLVFVGSDHFMVWFKSHVTGGTAFVVGIASILAYYWILVGLFKLVGVIIRALFSISKEG